MGVKTVVVKYSPKAEKMAKRIEDKINEMEALGYEFITFSINGSAKAILIFKDRLEETEKQQEAYTTAAILTGGQDERSSD